MRIRSYGPLDLLWSGGGWLEGPVALPGGDVLFSDIPNDRVMRWSPDGRVAVEQRPAAYPNGQTLDRHGLVVRCEQGNRRVVRVEDDGSTTPLAESYRGRRLNSPNDVVVRSDGSVWFTDPPYGITVAGHGHPAEPELEASFVFRVDGAGGEPRIATDALVEPNGLAFSPDETVLYVSDSAAAAREAHGGSPIHAFDVSGERLGAPRLFARVSSGLADGLCVRGDGCLFSSSGAGVEVFDPAGRCLDLIEVPEVVTNCAFSGRTLFITGVRSLYTVEAG